MKTKLEQMVRKAAQDAYTANELKSDVFGAVVIEEPKLLAHGDFSTNFALAGASAQKMPPRKIAEAIVRHISDPENIISRTEIAGPGFINFYINPSAWHPVVRAVHEQGSSFGATDLGKGKRVQVEFVSANPTGPLHVGHGRGAVLGDALASILNFCGYVTDREYYINDAGRQILTLGRSVYLRCLEHAGKTINFPEDAYQGEYISDMAKSLLEEKTETFLTVDEESAIDIAARYAAGKILDDIREDLSRLGIAFETWFSEQGLYNSGKVDEAIRVMKEKDLAYEEDGATWFKSSLFGDEKDRVIVRGNGQTTYFASDIAYHKNKYDRGYDKVIDVWGADHHGYVPRLSAAIAAMGYGPGRFKVILAHLVNLLRQGEPVSMSTRAGQFVTLNEVIEEVGVDATRFIFLTRHHESPLDFDLEVAKQKSNDNPVYYVQYVYARISSIIKKAAAEHGIEPAAGEKNLHRITEPEEIQLIKHLFRYPEVIAGAATVMEPHRVTYYLMDLAAAFHAYYNKHRVLGEDVELSAARLYLVEAVRTIIGNGLRLLRVNAPEVM